MILLLRVKVSNLFETVDFIAEQIINIELFLIFDCKNLIEFLAKRFCSLDENPFTFIFFF